MITIYRKTKHAENFVAINEFKAGAWIEMIAPTDDEISRVSKELEIPLDFLTTPLDEEERSRIDIENDTVLVVLRLPYHEKKGKFDTAPIGIILTPSSTVTVCLNDNQLLADIRTNVLKESLYTTMKTRFLLQLFRRITYYYIVFLGKIEKQFDETEVSLLRSSRNEDVIQFLNMQKSLIYFNNGLIANSAVLDRITKGTIMNLYDEDKELLDDITVEIKQAQDSVSIYSNVTSNLMDAYASIVSNNLNQVMKFLTSVTIITSVPAIIVGLYGMNVSLPWSEKPWAFVMILGVCVGLSLLTALIFRKKDLL